MHFYFRAIFELFSHVSYPFGFSVMLCLSSHFGPKFIAAFYPVVGMSSCILLQLTGRIFFRYFEMFCFVYIV